MTFTMQANLNDRCSGILTKIGADAYNAYMASSEVPRKYWTERKEGDKLSTQLWLFAQIFGPHLVVGSDPIFAENVMEIEFHAEE